MVSSDRIDVLVEAALEAQREEYATEFTSTNGPLQLLLDALPTDERLMVGRSLLSSDETQRRVLGARILREGWESRADKLRLVVESLRVESDDDVIGWLVSSVGFLGDVSCVPDLLGFADHHDPFVRDQAAGALSRCGLQARDPEAIDALLRLAEDAHAEVRFSAVFELAEWWVEGCRDDRVEGCLRALLEETDARVGRIAREALADGSQL